ncbi:MAG TPA: zinc ABC transporter substrate-binding protein [Pirellulaceae bacterium]|nr:zinc ABC transporter substrate-binding protein [Pirellulaceae bacterium]
MSRTVSGLWLVLTLLLVPLAVGCADSPAPGADKTFAGKHPIRVVCTTGMVADLVRNVGGEHVQVTALMKAGVDPHLYQASPGDIVLLNGADAIFYSGLHLEGRMTDVLESMGNRKPAVAVASAIPADQVLHDESGAHDPHLWFDVALWSQAANAIRDSLCAFDSPHAEDYRANTEKYQERLARLHEETKAAIEAVPEDHRVMVTAHDAFRYFGRAYKVDVRGIQGISTDSEAGVKKINELVNFLVERKIKAVFVETSVSNENVRALLEGCDAKGHNVVIGGELFSDAMGAEGTPEGTYEGMIRHNVNTIVKALK